MNPPDTPRDALAPLDRDDGSLVRNDVLIRLQRRIGLAPPEGLGLWRRAVFWALLGWAPIAVWAVINGRAIGNQVDEPLLAHFGVHARFLISVPLLILAEGVMHGATRGLFHNFERSGLVPEAARGRFMQVLADVARLRDATWPWLTVIGVVLAILTFAEIGERAHQVQWAVEGPPATGRLGFGGWWLLYVARPIFLTLALGWLWRVVLMAILFARIARTGLAIVPTHPDGVGGLGFVDDISIAFAPVVFAISVVLAAGYAHDAVYHAVDLRTQLLPIGVFVVGSVAICCAPFLLLAGSLRRARAKTRLDYGMLFGRHGRLVHQRWIEGRQLDDDALLNAPELGPLADTQAAYDAVRKMRTVPLDKGPIAVLVLAAVLPQIAAFATEFPVTAILMKIVKALL